MDGKTETTTNNLGKPIPSCEFISQEIQDDDFDTSYFLLDICLISGKKCCQGEKCATCSNQCKEEKTEEFEDCYNM